MKRLIAVVAIALAMASAAACNPDDAGSPGVDDFSSPSLESPALSSPGLESMAPLESPPPS